MLDPAFRAKRNILPAAAGLNLDITDIICCCLSSAAPADYLLFVSHNYSFQRMIIASLVFAILYLPRWVKINSCSSALSKNSFWIKNLPPSAVNR
jgi:hypothetical protein